MLHDRDLKPYYPEDFEIDMNGHKVAWKGVAKLPFLDRDLLIRKTQALTDDKAKWTDEELLRNQVGNMKIVVRNVKEKEKEAEPPKKANGTATAEAKPSKTVYEMINPLLADPRRVSLTSLSSTSLTDCVLLSETCYLPSPSKTIASQQASSSVILALKAC